jgi:Ca2+-transporting ATPase
MEQKRQGLTSAEVTASRSRYGENVLTPPRRKSLWKLYLEKFEDPIIRILLVAAAVSLALAFVENDFIETIGIILAVLFATTVGFYFERDAARKFDVLTALGEEQPVKVLRDGQVQEVPRRDVVVGDLVIVETGDEVPADGQLVEATDLQVDESSLTGEPIATKSTAPDASPSVSASEGAYPEDVLLRSSMVKSGGGLFVVSAVGDATEIGKVAREATELTAIKTPLNLQLSRLAKLISKIGSAVSVVAFIAFLTHDILTNPLWHTDNYIGMAEVVLRYFMMAVTLIVMAVPEGLPMAVTLALALNMRRMLKSNNLVRKLQASETMGAVTVICTDKTGTLTQNRMTVVSHYPLTTVPDASPSGVSLSLQRSIALNTTAHRGVGNPTEVALLDWLGDDYDFEAVRLETPVTERLPFSTERKYMATLAGGTLYVKGAPEIVLDCCDLSAKDRQQIDEVLKGWQQRAMRTLAFATKKADSIDVAHLQFVAVCAINDPLREDVPQAVADCHKAGIEVKIVTGDTKATALEIGRQAGVFAALNDKEERINDKYVSGAEFAAMSDEEALQTAKALKIMYRARPHDKQRLVELLQRSGEVVAVTGDGTNDAPALNHAHVGLSLGSGTSVAKEASDITLIDDSFRSIVLAVMWGRSLYKNIQRFIFFQLVVNVTALLLVLSGSAMGTELPLTVTQILWVNLIMDTFAAMALASLPPSREVMDEKPRSQNDFIISRPMAWGIALWGLAFFAAMFAFLWHIEQSGEGITVGELTVFFTTFVMLQWWNLLNTKTFGSSHSAFHHLLRCRGMLLVLAMILVGQWLIVTFGGKMFRTEPLSLHTWLIIIVATSPVLIIGELYRMLRRMMFKV